MRKFTKEISALLAAAAVGTTAYASLVSASSEPIEQVEGLMVASDENTEPTTEEFFAGVDMPEETTLPPTAGEPMPPDELIETTTEEEIPPLMGDIAPADGDVNSDGSFSVADVVLFQKWLLAVPDIHLSNWWTADYNYDGKLDVFDLCLMKKALIEKMNDTPVIDEPTNYGISSYDEYLKFIEDNNLQGKMVTYDQISYFGKFIQLHINSDWNWNNYFSLFYILDDGSGKTFDLIINDLDHKSQDNHDYVKLSDDQVNLSDMRNVETDAEYAYFDLYNKRYNYQNGKLFQIVWFDDEHEYKIIGNPWLSDYPYVNNTYLAELLGLTSVSPVAPPLSQPIDLNNMEEVKDLLNNYDLNAYPEESHDNYRKMFDRFKEDGYIYYFSENEDAENRIQLDSHPNAKIWLNPYANYEDTGIVYNVTYKDKAYQVYFYFTDSAYSGQYNGMSEYIDQRFHFKNIKEIAQKFAVMTVNYEQVTQLCAYSIIDNEHYYAVKTTASEDELMDFLNVLEYKKVNF